MTGQKKCQNFFDEKSKNQKKQKSKSPKKISKSPKMSDFYLIGHSSAKKSYWHSRTLLNKTYI